MDDREFLDVIYAAWAKSTGAENQFWIVEEQEGTWEWDGNEEWKEPGEGWDVFSLDKDQIKTKVGNFDNEVDADFAAGLHSCVGDLVRRMHAALDEADRADKGADEREQEIFKLAVENQELREELKHRTALQEDASQAARNTIAENEELRGKLASAASKAADALWKIERPM